MRGPSVQRKSQGKETGKGAQGKGTVTKKGKRKEERKKRLKKSSPVMHVVHLLTFGPPLAVWP